MFSSTRNPDIIIRDESFFNKGFEGVLALPPQIPQAIADAVKRAPNISDVLPIYRTERFAQQVVKAREIVWDDGARLQLTGLQYPWIAIAARNFKFRKPTNYSFIERDPSVANGANGAAGARGSDGAAGSGETNRRGNDGLPGGRGQPGAQGVKIPIPDIYIVAERIIDDRDREIPAGVVNLALLIRGVAGGNGGRGGEGGNGGRGANGKEGATSLFDCKEGPGQGGTGGAAGQGALGGRGGDGSNGGNVVFASLANGADVFSYTLINNQGAPGGVGGPGGAPGRPGRGGSGGPSNGWCKSGDDGHSGGYPNPASLGTGPNGSDGAKGTAFTFALPDLSAFF